jgi:hypothetical protein
LLAGNALGLLFGASFCFRLGFGFRLGAFFCGFLF